MDDVDMIAAIRMNDVVYVWDTWSLSDAEPPQDVDLGGTDDITIISTTLNPDGGFTAVFSRPLDTGDEYDKKLEAGMSLNYCWATYNREKFDEHNHDGNSNMKLGLTQADSELGTDDDAVALGVIFGMMAFLAL